MTRPADPVQGVPDAGRYAYGSDRYDTANSANVRKGVAGCYYAKPITLEEECDADGWIPGARPTGEDDSLIRLFTLGMRGEPGYDDDPSPAADGRGYAKPSTPAPDNTSWD